MLNAPLTPYNQNGLFDTRQVSPIQGSIFELILGLSSIHLCLECITFCSIIRCSNYLCVTLIGKPITLGIKSGSIYCNITPGSNVYCVIIHCCWIKVVII